MAKSNLVTADVVPFASTSTPPDVRALAEQSGVFRLMPSSSPEQVAAAITSLRDALLVTANSGPLDWEIAKALVNAHCKGMEIKDYSGLVRIGLKRPDAPEPDLSDSSPVVRDDPPAAIAVPGAALLDHTVMVVRRHVVVSEAQARAIALWVAASYVIDALQLMPFLLITAPTMRAGKSTLLMLVSALVPRALTAASLTPAVLPRAVAAYRPTLLMDEADTWLTDDKSELKGIVNAGHVRKNASRIVCHPVTLEPTVLPCFCARVIAMIGRPAATITDRSIAIELRRKRDGEHVERLRLDRLDADHEALRSQWVRWAADHLDQMRDIDPALPEGLNDRAMDNWRPLVHIADLARGGWPEWARATAVELSEAEDSTEENITIELLQDIRTAFDGAPALSSADLVKALVEMTDRPWAEWSSGKPMTAAKLAYRLKTFKIKTHKVRVGSKTVNTYHASDFHDAWGRYLTLDSEQSEQPNKIGPFSAKTGLGTNGSCSESENAKNSNEIGPCSDCSESKPVLGLPFACAKDVDDVPEPAAPVGGGHGRRY